MKRIHLGQHALKIQITKQLLEHSAHVILSCCEARLSYRHTQGRGVRRHLSDKGGTASDGGVNRAAQGLAITDQLIKIACPTWDLGDGPVPDGGADGSDSHLQEELAEANRMEDA